MRNIIIGFSIFFLALSGIVIYKTLRIPSNNIHYQNNPQGLKLKSRVPLPEAEDNLRQFAKEHAEKRPLVEEMQPAKVKLKDELSEKNEIIQANVETKVSSKKAKVLAVLGDGMFRSGQFIVDSNLKTAVKEFVPDIMASPDYRVIIEGHTDNLRPSTGKRYIDNMELSFLRAKAIALILVENGISPERISVIGYGDIRPVASNETTEGRAKNRRVEVKLIPGDKEF